MTGSSLLEDIKSLTIKTKNSYLLRGSSLLKTLKDVNTWLTFRFVVFIMEIYVICWFITQRTLQHSLYSNLFYSIQSTAIFPRIYCVNMSVTKCWFYIYYCMINMIKASKFLFPKSDQTIDAHIRGLIIFTLLFFFFFFVL